MTARSNYPQFVLFYRPPNGKWYVHSHKIYPTKRAAREAAKEFLAPGTPISIRAISADALGKLEEIV